MTELDIFIKGEPPISKKFNSFTTSFSDDLNIIGKQIDYLSAILVNANNIFSSEIQQENKFIDRIRSKTKILQMYSTGPANDLYYIGNSFDSSDYIDFSKNENKDKMPMVQNGKVTLSTENIGNWTPRSVVILEGSNGYLGTNHSAYSSSGSDLNYKYHFLDTPTSRNRENVRDNNPVTFFEYEQINVTNKNTQSRDYEYEYYSSGGPENSIIYDNWSSFKSDSLRLNLGLERETAELANFITIVPYFGSNNNPIKDIKVNRIDIINDLDQVENILPRPITIGASSIPPSIDAANSFYHKEAKIYFLERKVKKINIYFEQSEFNSVKIKHVYFRPDSSSTVANPYVNQERFDPDQPTVVAGLLYPSIPWSRVSYNRTDLTPRSDQPNLFKSEVYNTKTIDVDLQRQVPAREGYCVKVKGLDQRFYRITPNFFNVFNSETSSLSGYTGINDRNISNYISDQSVQSEGGAYSPYLSTDDTIILSELDSIVQWFNTTTSQGTSVEKYTKFKLDTSFPAVKELTQSSDLRSDSRRYRVPLIRQFEILDGQRKAIGIRDITVGQETYVQSAEIISRQYDVPNEIEYMTFSAEVDFSGPTAASASDAIKYYISLDGGSKWMPISSIENPFASIPEVLAFNINIDKNFKIPGVSYFNQPDIPSSVKSFIVKIELNKPSGSNVTPIVFSYKVGVKVRQ